MKKLESTFANMVLSLVIIAVVAAAALAGIYTVTKDTIDEQKAAKEQKAILSVLPNQGEGAVIEKPDTVRMEVSNGKKKEMIVYRAYKDSDFIGSAVNVSEQGFGGKFKIMVGFDAESVIVDYSVLEHQETPGLGDKMGKWFKTDKNRQSILKRKATGEFTVSKDGGDVDAITAATISSRGFLSAVNNAAEAFGVTRPALEKDRIEEPELENDSVPAILPEEPLVKDSVVNEQMVNEQMDK